MAKHKKETAQAPIEPVVVPQEISTPTTAGLAILENPMVACLCLFVAAFVAYGGSISNDFVFFDDDKAILYNKALQNPSFSGFFKGQNLGMFAPFTWIAYWVGKSISGNEAWGYHLLGVLFHAINAVLAYLVLSRLTDKKWVSFGAVLLFAVHPIQAEAVCWAAGLSAVLFATFYLAALLAWVSWSKNSNKIYYGLALLAFIAACLSKSAAVTLPLVLVLFDVYKGKSIFTAGFWLEKAPFFALSLYFGLNTFSTRAEEGHDIVASSSVFSAADRFFMVCQTLLFYPFKTLLPLGYSVAYPFVKEQGSWGITYLAAPLVLAGLAYLVYKYLRNSPNYLLGLGLYFLPLVVMLPFRTVGSFELRSDRYAYLSSLGMLFVLFLFLEKLDTKLRNGVLIAAAVVLGFLAIQQAQVWNNGVDLFKNCVDKTPESSLCQCNLAYNSLLTKQYEAAVDHYTAALKYDPSTIEAYNGRGQAYMELRKFPEAYSDFDQAIKGGLSSPKLFLNRGKCLVINGQPEKAIPDLGKSLELEPKSPEAYYFRATAYDKTNQPDQALKDYGQALAQNPNYIEAMVNRGQLQFKSQQYAAAIEDFTNGLAIAADAVKPMILVNRANAYLMSGNTQSALEDANQALAINPNFQRGYHSRAAIWKTLGNAAKAAEDLKKAGN